MEPIDNLVWDSEVPDRTYQKYWNSENLSKILEFGGSEWNLSMILVGIQRFWMEPIDDFSWNSEVPDGTY
ncbi:unnamed protein product [Rhizophagus irregularis]|nr:unnamed protein product [Rhizophagus irregularis]